MQTGAVKTTPEHGRPEGPGPSERQGSRTGSETGSETGDLGTAFTGIATVLGCRGSS